VRRILKEELEAFRKSLPEDVQHETYRFLNVHYCVVSALFMVQKLKLKTRSIDVAKWCEGLGMAGPRDDKAVRLFNGVNDKDVMEAHINPQIPLIIVEHTWKDRSNKTQMAHLVIDGNKRLRRAFLDGLTKVEAYVLDKRVAKELLL